MLRKRNRGFSFDKAYWTSARGSLTSKKMLVGYEKSLHKEKLGDGLSFMKFIDHDYVCWRWVCACIVPLLACICVLSSKLDPLTLDTNRSFMFHLGFLTVYAS